MVQTRIRGHTHTYVDTRATYVIRGRGIVFCGSGVRRRHRGGHYTLLTDASGIAIDLPLQVARVSRKCRTGASARPGGDQSPCPDRCCLIMFISLNLPRRFRDSCRRSRVSFLSLSAPTKQKTNLSLSFTNRLEFSSLAQSPIR